jgi:hypothetical protein
MSGKKACVPLVIIAVLGTTSAAWSGMESGDRTGDIIQETTHAMPCSLVGFNPSWHPEFNDPANAKRVAKEFGYIKSPDGTWHLDKSCTGGRATPEPASPHGPRRTKKKAP